jgi:hypothetical protein
MDEFGETPTIYIWPKDHEEGEPFPEDFWKRLGEALDAAGYEWETV